VFVAASAASTLLSVITFGCALTVALPACSSAVMRMNN
jgi:hypothetical protein